MKNSAVLICVTLFSLLLFVVSSAFGAVAYVASGGSVTAPYDTWAKAAVDIQTALGVVVAGDTVWVSNGVYGGAMGVAASCTNTVIIPTGVTLRSVNGPPFTMIQGADEKRCVFLSGSNTVLNGFTLTGGALANAEGGGVYCASNALLTNCLVILNSATNGGGVCLSNATMAICAVRTNVGIRYGGGIYLRAGFVNSCLIESNATTVYYGGGIYAKENAGETFGGRIQNCVIQRNYSRGNGGGIFGNRTEIEACTITENRTRSGSYDGGGVHLARSNSLLQNSLISSNYSGRNGGGVFSQDNPQIQNCTILENTTGDQGGGTTSRDGSAFENCIIYDNYSERGFAESNHSWYGSAEPSYTNCCMAPLTNGTGNIDLDPQIDGMSGQLLGTSPCVDAGTNQAWMAGATDLEGDPRLFNEIVDIGSDETRVVMTSINGDVMVDCRVPKGIRYLWQFTWRTDGNWTDWDSVIRTSTTTSVTIIDMMPTQQSYYRVKWIK